MNIHRNFEYILHPFLFALFPVMFLYARNSGQTYPGDIIIPALIVLGACIAALIVVRLILRNEYKAGIVVSLLVLFFFTFGHVARLLDGVMSVWVLLLLWPIILIILIGAVIRSEKRFDTLTRTLNFVAAALLLIQVVQIGINFVSGGKDDTTDASETRIDSDGSNNPDIYYIILDGYAREDVLADMYNFDNSSFIDYLKNHGFAVADSGRSNYCQTLLSLAATFNMDYAHKLGGWHPQSEDRLPLYEIFRHNKLFDILEDAGYEITAYASGYSLTELKNAGNYISPSWLPGEFANMLISTTPLPVILNSIYSPFEIHHNRVEHVLDNLAKRKNDGTPEFVFAHLVCPHPPFVFGADGQSLQPDRPFNMEDGSHFLNEGGTVEEYRCGYIDQVQYINRRMTEVIDHLLAEGGDNPPVIIIQGDHGPGSELSWVGSATTNIKERFSILNAIHLPGMTENNLDDNISSVNTFRLVLDKLFDAGLPLLPDISFYTTWQEPFHYMPVTNDSGRLYDYLLEHYLALNPGIVEYRHVSHVLPADISPRSHQCAPIPEQGLCVVLEKPYDASVMEIALDSDNDYTLNFRTGGRVLSKIVMPALNSAGGTLRVERMAVPDEAVRSGYDNILIVPGKGDGMYSLGHIRFGHRKIN